MSILSQIWFFLDGIIVQIIEQNMPKSFALMTHLQSTLKILLIKDSYSITIFSVFVHHHINVWLWFRKRAIGPFGYDKLIIRIKVSFSLPFITPQRLLQRRASQLALQLVIRSTNELLKIAASHLVCWQVLPANVLLQKSVNSGTFRNINFTDGISS